MRATLGDNDETDATFARSHTEPEQPSLFRADDDADPFPAGTVLAGRYEIRRSIGRGGMGVVAEAFDRTLGVQVAIKIVRAGYAGDRRWSERLAREVKLARQIQHSNVCRVFDFAQANGRAFLSMELAGGGTLRSQLSDSTAFARPIEARLADARAIAAGVAAIHAAGIVHRDLSPQNVLRMDDGRLVVADFGLATDSPGGTTSIHGGTVAYMAPEVSRGGRATVAADIFALGVVIHEVVLGAPPRWDPRSGELRGARPRTPLTRTERSVLELCRACTAPDPAERPRDVGTIAARLSEAGLARAAHRRWRRRVVAALAAGLLIVGAVAGGRRAQSWGRQAGPTAAAPADSLMIVPTGEPDDWTDKAKVLAEVPDTIRCMVALPNRQIIRFVWGYPAHAEDLDTRTGGRRPSPLAPETYAEGCPDLSPEGGRLVYAGHTPDDRAFAFVSPHADGHDAVPEVQIGEPGANSAPVWLSDGKTFVYDVDDRHVATFSVATKRSLVLPTASAPLITSFHEAIGENVFVTSWAKGGWTGTSGFDYPVLREILRWRLPFPAMGLTSRDGTTYYSSGYRDRTDVFVEIEPNQGRARFVGTIPGQVLRRPLFVNDGLALTSTTRTATLVLRTSAAEPTRVPVSRALMGASACGDKLVATQWDHGTSGGVWIDRQGRIGGRAVQDDMVTDLQCGSDGRVMFYASMGERPGIGRCEGGGCRLIVSESVFSFALSPDDRRLAFVAADNGGRAIRWISGDGVGPLHQIADAETGCQPIWSNARDIWVSLRKGPKVTWTEIDTDTARPTGRTAPGLRDCTDGRADPARPLHGPVEIELHDRSQVRLLPAYHLSRGAGSR